MATANNRFKPAPEKWCAIRTAIWNPMMLPIHALMVSPIEELNSKILGEGFAFFALLFGYAFR
jgi:hypothetical protein